MMMMRGDKHTSSSEIFKVLQASMKAEMLMVCFIRDSGCKQWKIKTNLISHISGSLIYRHEVTFMSI